MGGLVGRPPHPGPALLAPAGWGPPALATTLVKLLLGRSRPEWQSSVDRRFGALDWASVDAVAEDGRTVRSESFATVYADMREVIMLDPDASW